MEQVFFSCLRNFSDIKNDNFKIEKKISFPHSLGIFYQTVTQYLGFKYYGEEYKVMGLAAYGKKKYVDEMYKLFKIKKNNSYELNLKIILNITINHSHIILKMVLLFLKTLMVNLKNYSIKKVD